MGIIACDFRKSLYECDSTWEVASVFQAVTNIKTNYKVGDIICIHLTFTSVLSSKSSFKSILRYKITSMSRASSSSGLRRSPYSIFTNVSIWGHIRRLSNLFDWLSFTYISEFCWKNYYNLSYRWALIISSLSFKKKNLTYYTKPYICISLSVKVLYVSTDTRLSTFHQCGARKVSRLLWFSFLTAAKIFLCCTSVHPALCPNIT